MLALAKTLAEARCLQAQARSAEQKENLDHILTRLGYLAEAILLDLDAVDEPITRQHVEDALRTFTDPSWLASTSDPERRTREFHECTQLGLFPVDLLRAALEDPSFPDRPLSPVEALEELIREIQAWCDQVEAQRS
jgi:hypothetical protein